MKFTPFCFLLTASLLPFSTLLLRADDTPTSAQAAQLESVKRQQLVFSANQAIGDGQRLLTSAKYDEAADRFQYAVDALTNGGVSAPIYSHAQAGLAQAKAGQAEILSKDGKFAQAAARLREAITLQPSDPTYTKALADLQNAQEAYEAASRNPEGIDHNPAVTEDFKNKVATVQKLLFQGDAYFRTGRYDRAGDTFSKVLILDPYNKAARDRMARVERYKIRADNFRHEGYEKEAFQSVDEKWSEAISPDLVIPPTVNMTTSVASNRANITRKLQSIIIDKVDFEHYDIARVIDFLTAKSKELDPDKQGVNFVLRLTTDTPPAPPAGANGAPAPAAGAAPAVESTPTIHREVSITLENVPLANVLDYIVQQTNLQYSIDDYAVYLRPSIDEGENLAVRTYLAPPNFFRGSSLKVTVGASSSDQPSTVESISSDVQKELSDRGIRFPTGSSATFLPGSSKLVVRDTPEQLDLIANLIDQLSKETPQVQIEAKIAEFTEDAIKGLSFNYAFGATPITVGTTLLPTPTTLPGGSFNGATALRNSSSTTSGSAYGGLTPNGIDALIQQNTANNSGLAAATYPNTGTTVAPNVPNELFLGAIIDSVGFGVLIDAINNTKGVSLLSAPSVLTQSGLKANIDIVREFPYPTSFEKPKLSNSDVAYQNPDDPNNPTYVTLGVPPTPREFVTQDVGVSLEVKPTTYPDQRIDLDITKAQVVDFDGFIDYGAPIMTRYYETGDASVITAGTINQPVFNIRSMATKLQVLDGQTAVLGGLIREDTQEINDKVPVLGDMPLVGRLFQSKVSERTKKNLLIFVTARLIRSNGKLQYMKTLDAEPVEEALPQPEPLGPGITLPPGGEPNS